ncbi:hypothetical protein D0Z00_000487 [Geotrichum galactomycetum]|uniref:Uncharacterized protein n=1 Tax=Geotrichum galactomycetum TaxID=27317 RepID=A0ACB6V9T5_9ASCO|nr:hypothetical protein D0Z00_000487 [Geotrichum candidum]
MLRTTSRPPARPDFNGASKKNSTRHAGAEQSKAPIVSSYLVHANIKYLPRHRLGTLIYEPASEPFLPCFEGKENSLVNVKIPRQFLSKAFNENVEKRKVWGTDIYTDDSDVVAALYHAGRIPAAIGGETGGLPEEARTNSKKSTALGSPATPDDSKNKENDTGAVKLSNLTTDRPAPGSVEADGDCLVTLLILPRLKLYKGTFRNGYNSRTWLTKHDGVSFAIHEVKFIPRGDIEETYSLQKRRIGAWEEERQDIHEKYLYAKRLKTELSSVTPASRSDPTVSS